MGSQLELGDITVDVVRKDIKNLHLRVFPPAGHVRISAPDRMSLNAIRIFVIAKLGWIKKQQARIRLQQHETPHEYLSGENHFVWGKRYLLAVSESNERPSVELAHSNMLLRVRPGTCKDKRQAVVEAWYREQLKQALPPLLTKWQPLLGVSVERFFVRRMKTRWGTCNTKVRTIRLNTELVKRPVECLEYVVVHELVHLLEPSHNSRFVALMDRFMPAWKFHRQELDRRPIRREEWGD